MKKVADRHRLAAADKLSRGTNIMTLNDLEPQK